MDVDAECEHPIKERGKELAVIDLPLIGKKQAARKPVFEFRLESAQRLRIHRLDRLQVRHQGGLGRHLLGKAVCFGRVLSMPNNKGTFLLEIDR